MNRRLGSKDDPGRYIGVVRIATYWFVPCVYSYRYRGSLPSDDYLLSGNVHREKYFSIKNRYTRRWNRGKEGNDEERARIVARWENRSALSGYRASMPFCSRTRRLRATFHSHDDREPAGYWCRAYFREVNRYKCLIFGT